MSRWFNSKKMVPAESQDVIGFWFGPDEAHIVYLFQGGWFRRMDDEEFGQPDFWMLLPKAPKEKP